MRDLLPVSFQCATAARGGAKKSALLRRTAAFSAAKRRSNAVRESVAQKCEPSKSTTHAQNSAGNAAGTAKTSSGSASVTNAPPVMNKASNAGLDT
jgi:hypothetical protein